jgi:hypothetical protein
MHEENPWAAVEGIGTQEEKEPDRPRATLPAPPTSMYYAKSRKRSAHSKTLGRRFLKNCA